MENGWMGRYRPLIAAIVKHTNLIAKIADKKTTLATGEQVSIHEWQVFEYIIEHESDDDRMIHISERLSIPQSSFSKMANYLCAIGLIEKTQMPGNRKNIILKPTEYGRQVYSQRVSVLGENLFFPFFEYLESVGDDGLNLFVKAFEQINASIEAFQESDDIE